MAIFRYDEDLKKVVPVDAVPAPRNNTKDHVNMRTTWSGTTQIEFNSTTIEKSAKKMNKEKGWL